VLCVIVLLYSYSTTGEFFQKDISIKGGVAVTVLQPYEDIDGLSKSLTQYIGAPVSVRTLSQAGMNRGVIVDASIESDEEVQNFISLIQEKTGRLYPFRPGIAKRKDMSIFDPEKAQRRIEANLEILKDAKVTQSPESQAKHSADVAELQKVAQELTATENAIDATHQAPAKELGEHANDPQNPTQEEKEAEARKDKINKDEQVVAIKGMKTGAELAKYIRK